MDHLAEGDWFIGGGKTLIWGRKGDARLHKKSCQKGRTLRGTPSVPQVQDPKRKRGRADIVDSVGPRIFAGPDGVDPS